MKRIYLFLLSLLSGLLLICSFYPTGVPIVSFFAFVPLFVISDELLQKHNRFSFGQGILYAFPAFFIWNAGTTWWIWNSTPEGSIATFFLNSLFMSMVYACWHCAKRQSIPPILHPIIFISFWMSWELLHLNWDLTWPWLNLGNIFAPATQWVQWYEFTGAFGGTLWILITNFLLFYALKSLLKRDKKRIAVYSSLSVASIFLPILFSVILYQVRYKEMIKRDKNPIEVVIVQQNTDPWNEQYVMSNTDHVIRLLNVAGTKITPKTQLIVCSESAIPHNISGSALLEKNYPIHSSHYYGFHLLDTVISQQPNLNFILGISTFFIYPEKVSETSRDRGDGLYVDMFNTSSLYDSQGCEALYFKSRLVPGVEKMPFPKVFSFLENIIIDLGGFAGSLGTDTSQRAFNAHFSFGDCKIGAPICYESIYGQLFSAFVRDGAQVMTVITNDSWWGNTPGHKQHFVMAKLRAVETRRTICRAANTGFSGFIDEVGDVHQKTNYDERIAIKETVYPNNELTFYTLHGDYLARFALCIAALSLICTLYFASLRLVKFLKHKNNRNN